MQSSDARMLLRIAAPSAVAGAVGVVAGAVLLGGQGAIGAGFGAVLAMFFMGIGLVVLQRTARSYPSLFQAMGLMLYTAQLLLLAIVLALFKNTTLFDHKAFALSLVAVALVWVAAQARAHMKSKILYVQPESTAKTSESAGSQS